MIEIRNIKKQYETTCPLQDINVTILNGDVISIIGPSGTGKSTLLRMINLLEEPTSGQIFIDGEEITAPGYKKEKARQKMAMVFQSYNLFNHLSVLENLIIPQIDLLHRTKKEAYHRAILALEKVNLSKQYLNYPSSLSGGQKQRAAIARAIVMDPDVFLFDEPTSALDPFMVDEIKQIMKTLADEGKTMIIVTHDMELAETVSNRVLYLDQGIVYEDDKPKVIFHNPKRTRTKAFIESLNVFKYSIHDVCDRKDILHKLDKYIDTIKPSNTNSNNLKAIIEDLVFNLLLDEEHVDNIRVIITFNKKTGIFEVNIKYDGDIKDVLTSNSESSNRIKSFASNIEYSKIAEDEYRNCITFTFN